MVAHLEKHLSARGVALIPPALGTAFLIDELNQGGKGQPEVLIAGVRGPGDGGPSGGQPTGGGPSGGQPTGSPHGRDGRTLTPLHTRHVPSTP